MASVSAAQPAWVDTVTDRLAESLDRLFVAMLGLGLVLWLPFGFGMRWLGDHFDRPFLVSAASLLLYLGVLVLGLTALRWLAYMTMPRMATLLDREVGAYFLSPIVYLVLIAMLVVNLINFWQLVTELHQVRLEVVGEASPITGFISYNLWFWLGMLFVIPVITMRLLAEEKRSGTIEVLMTAPVTEVQVVLSKFFASLLFYALAILPGAVYLMVLRAGASFKFELLPVVAVYMGTFTVGAMFLSIGLFFSSLTRNQIIAAMLTFAALMILFSTFVLEWFAQRVGPTWGAVVRYIAVLPHLGELGKGQMDIKFLLFHTSVVIFMLFVTVKVVEARKWR